MVEKETFQTCPVPCFQLHWLWTRWIRSNGPILS